MLYGIILVVHVIVCMALILIILLQSGKGADIGAVFGGGSSQTVFGSTGAATFLSKFTIGAAVIFMCTSIILTIFSGRVATLNERSLMTEQKAPISGPAVPQSQGQDLGKEQKAPGESQETGSDTGQNTTPPVSDNQTGTDRR
ncbi:MAG: preprotein translocase subunit SecG [Desulfomonilaceae bacterium]